MDTTERLNQHKEMMQKILDKETLIAEEIVMQINDFYNQEEQDWEELYNIIKDLIYISLRQTYKMTLKELNDIYNLQLSSPKTISEKQINDYVYSKDKKTLIDRIKEHINNAKKEEITQETLKYNLIRLLDNETKTVNHKLTKAQLKKKKFEYGMIFSGGGCDRECCNVSVEEWIPIEEVEEPPYHPNCSCEVIYIDEEVDLNEEEE